VDHGGAVAYVKVIVPDPAKDGKKCGHPGDNRRVFDLRNSAATQEACKQECADKGTCVAFSGIWQDWCIGCETPLDVDHGGAVAYVKASTLAPTPAPVPPPPPTEPAPSPASGGGGGGGGRNEIQ